MSVRARLRNLDRHQGRLPDRESGLSERGARRGSGRLDARLAGLDDEGGLVDGRGAGPGDVLDHDVVAPPGGGGDRASDVAALGVKSKAPFQLMTVREALMWRTEELARNACDALDRADCTVAAMLIRGIAESTAMTWGLLQILQRNINDRGDT